MAPGVFDGLSYMGKHIGLALAAFNFVAQAQTRCEFILITSMLGKAAAGTYSAATGALEAAYVPGSQK